MLKNKKGIALNQAFAAVLTLVLIGVLIIVGIVLFVNLGSTFTELRTDTTINESVNMTIATPQTLDNSTLCNFGSVSVTTVINESTGVVIAAGNYTVSGATIVNSTAAFAFPWLVTYDVLWGGDACVANTSMITQFGTYPVLIGLVGTIIFLGLVIGVLVASFVFGGRGSRV